MATGVAAIGVTAIGVAAIGVTPTGLTATGLTTPAENSGLVLAESMHPSGNPWMFHFTHRYSMTEGHIGVEILTTTPQGLAEANPDRYKDLVVQQGQADAGALGDEELTVLDGEG